MKRNLGLLSIGSIAVASLVALSIQAGCASDEDPADDNGGSGGSTAAGGTAGSTNAGSGGAAGGNTAGAGGSTAGTGGGTAGSGTGGSGGIDANEYTIAQIANSEVPAQTAVAVKGAIATTNKMVISYNKNSGSCTWAVFLKDPSADRGTMLVSKGQNGALNDVPASCPKGTDAIPDDVVTGDLLDITGETDTYAPQDCTEAAQVQIEAISVVKTGSGTAPAPVVVNLADLDSLAAGAAAYQGLLVQINDINAENYDGGTVGPYGIIELEGTTLHVRDDFYWRETGAGGMTGGPEFDASQHFTSIVGLMHLHYTCDWSLQPRDKCSDFNPASTDCL